MMDDRKMMMERRKEERRLELRRVALERKEEKEPAMYFDVRAGIDRRRGDRRNMIRRLFGNA